MTDSTRSSDPLEPGAAPASAARRPRAAVAAALLTLVEALLLLLLAGFYGYEIGIGAADSLTTAVTSGALILVFAVGLLLVARGWARGESWPRTPTLVWNALLLPVAWSLRESEQTALAIGLAALALASLVAALATPARHPEGPGPAPSR
ncbi:hypothetical protein [Intrasporangium sp. DVR]|uniref:hypothetical protein n=1 Tax=Intrasporangium sp. DVR TaxID=3127867 RepID=UPI00313A5AFA